MRRYKLNLFLVLSLAQMGYCSGASFVVENGQIETTTQVLDMAGNTGLIEPRGTIATTADNENGIEMQANDQIVTNKGTITTEGTGANGVSSFVFNAVISNNGFIATQGDFAYGVLSQGNDTTINNKGSIATKGGSAYGVFSQGVDAAVSNSGFITTQGDFAYGIFSQGADPTINNNGSIVAEGNNASGIFSEGAGTTLFNCGTIFVSGTDADGVRGQGDNLNLTNAGTISSTKGDAINLQGTNPTLTVLKCSKIIGPVHSDDELNVNTKKGVNLLLTLDEDSAGFGDLNVEGFHAVRDNTLAVVDPRSFVMQPDVVADLSDTLLNGVDNPCYICNCGTSCATWAQGIGYIRERGKDCNRYEFHQGGFLVGFDATVCEGSRLSLFGGAVFGQNNKKGCGVCLKSDNYVGGLRFESCLCKGSFSYSGIFGSLSLDQTRPVFFNLVADGVLDAKSSRSGFFTAQEVNLQQCFAAWCLAPQVTATVRYAGFFPGGLKEHREGGFPNVCSDEADLVLKKQSINFVTTRLLVGLPYYSTCLEQCLKVEPYLGAAGRFQINGLNQKGTFFDESVCFSSYLPSNIASFLFGIKGCYSLCGLDCSLNLEGVTEGAHGSRFVGTGGVSYSY